MLLEISCHCLSEYFIPKIFFRRAPVSQRRSICQFLQIIQSAGDAHFTIVAEGIEVNGGSAVAAGVEAGFFGNAVQVFVYYARRYVASGVEVVGMAIDGIFPFVHIAVTKREGEAGKGGCQEFCVFRLTNRI